MAYTNNMKRKIIVAVVIVVILVAGVAAFKHRNNNDYGRLRDHGVKVSSETIYLETQEKRSGIPEKTIDYTGVPNTAIHWVQESVVDGSDGCSLYDTKSKQIYASQFITSGQIGYQETGITYFKNDKIDKKTALNTLDAFCFKITE